MMDEIDNVVVQIFSRFGCAPDEPGYFEGFQSYRKLTRKQALLKLAFTRAAYPSDCFRLRLEDWNTGETEIVEV